MAPERILELLRCAAHPKLHPAASGTVVELVWKEVVVMGALESTHQVAPNAHAHTLIRFMRIHGGKGTGSSSRLPFPTTIFVL